MQRNIHVALSTVLVAYAVVGAVLNWNMDRILFFAALFTLFVAMLEATASLSAPESWWPTIAVWSIIPLWYLLMAAAAMHTDLPLGDAELAGIAPALTESAGAAGSSAAAPFTRLWMVFLPVLIRPLAAVASRALERLYSKA